MTEPTLAGRVALLTGASGGIGGALGSRLIEAGARVAFAYGTRAGQPEQLVAQAKEAGLDAVALRGDLADPAVPARLVREATQALGSVELLIPNAGSGHQEHYTDIGIESWQRTLAVNLTAPFLLAQQVVPGMAERGFGRVLFVSSVAAFTGGRVGAHYAASKAGLHGMLHHIAARVAPQGVTVNAIAPMLIEDTEMLPPTADPARVPVRRFGRPEEVADLAMAVLRNGYLTNQVVNIDGGSYAR